MNIREARQNDNEELLALQAKCPQGTTLIVSTVNSPDFFARAKKYDYYKVFIAYDESEIVGSATVGVRNASINGNKTKVGYEFQYFTAPEHRRRGVAKLLHRTIEEHMISKGVVLSYALIMEGNHPSKSLFKSVGFKMHRTLNMTGLAVYERLQIEGDKQIRLMEPGDIGAVAGLMNDTWEGHDFYETASEGALSELFIRTPAFSYENMLLLEDNGDILACLGFWDWSQITQITVKSLSLKMKIIVLLLDIIRRFKPLPRSLHPGDVLKQIVVAVLGYRDVEHVTPLLRYLNNLAQQTEAQQIFLIFEHNHALRKSVKGFINIDTTLFLYAKSLLSTQALRSNPVYISGFDL